MQDTLNHIEELGTKIKQLKQQANKHQDILDNLIKTSENLSEDSHTFVKNLPPYFMDEIKIQLDAAFNVEDFREPKKKARKRKSPTKGIKI